MNNKITDVETLREELHIDKSWLAKLILDNKRAFERETAYLKHIETIWTVLLCIKSARYYAKRSIVPMSDTNPRKKG